MIQLAMSTLPLVLLSSALAASPAPAALWTDDGNVVEVPLAHREPRGRIDAGVLRVDRGKRVLTWTGLPEEIGCRLRIEARLEDVRGVAPSRGAGLTLALRRGRVRELVLIPPAHYALLAEPAVRERGGITREEAVAARLRTDNGEAYSDAAGSGAFGGPTGRPVAVPDAARRDIAAVVAIIRSAVGVER